ncbi:MAG TPA: M28 family metallopeptidase [Candidatus Didemnitutus sp.]|nr:M28 family metallopeptidase [Candidatus Didemnitutus sp.]
MKPLFACLPLFLGAGLWGADPSVAPALNAISGASIRHHTAVLSSDDFEGRAPGTAGEDKTVAYLESEFRRLGLAPGNSNGTYIQAVPMVGLTSKPVMSFAIGGQTLTPTFFNDFVANSRHVTGHVEVKDSDLVFVGYGVVAPEYGWDDYKGVDLHGKTVVMLINDPPIPDPKDPTKLDPAMFKGKAMTYYGRWTYKYEMATERGAAACIIVHETGPAAYPWAVVANSWGRENFDLDSPDGNAGRVPVESWITLETAQKLFAAAGKDFATLKRAALNRDFKPVPLPAKLTCSIDSTIRHINSRNVLARLAGSDPKLRDEWVIYTAHWDHFGRDPKRQGDQIFNGAHDNASGTSVLLELAQAFKALPVAPKRSVLFIAVTGEEQGLLGSRHYALNPIYPLRRTLANINMDGAQFIGRSRDLESIGYGGSTIDDLAAAELAAEGRVLVPDGDPGRGAFFRSDQFEFAKVGVPAFYTHYGTDIIGKPAGYGAEKRDDYIANFYHKVTDEIQPWWDFEGAAEDTRTLFKIGYDIANGDRWPEWKSGSEFKARRDEMMKQPER